MDWSDSVFREHVKYYGDIEYKGKNIIGDNGIVGSKKYLAFRVNNENVGILSTDFETNIDEKLAQGRKAEYGSKVYTTTKIDEIDANGANINVLKFNPFDDNKLFIGDSNGTLSIYDLTDVNNLKCSTSINEVSQSVYSIATHPSSSEIVACGGESNINIIDLTKGESVINTKIDDDQIVNMTFSENSNYLRCITKNKILFIYDPRTDQAVENQIKLRYSPNNIVNLYNDNEIAVSGLTSYLEPIVYAYDISAKLDDKLHETYLFKQNYNHKQCKPFLEYDRYSQILYIAFESCADVIALNTKSEFAKQALYHAVDDTFMAFTILPKQATKKREINKIIKFSKTRIQQIVHTRGGKLIYDKVTNSAKTSKSTAQQYLNGDNISYPDDDVAKLVPTDFEEEKKRTISLYIHVTGKEPLSNYEKYFDLKISQTANCNLGLNIKTNLKYALFPAPTYGGGALGIVQLAKPGRKKQASLTAHGEKITTFDVCRIPGNEGLVITGSPDTKAIIQKIKENSQNAVSGCDKLFTLQTCGKVTFVSFHPRIKNLCVIAANKDGSGFSNIYFYDYKDGKTIREVKLEGLKDIMDIQFEPVIGLIAAVSCKKSSGKDAGGQIRLIDIRSGKILKEFQSKDTSQRDTKLFWATNNGQNKPKYFNQLITVGFGGGSMRKFCYYGLDKTVTEYYQENTIISVDEAKKDDNTSTNDDEKLEDSEEPLGQAKAFGVSNAIPIGYYDPNDNLFYVSGIGDRKIRIYELNPTKGIVEMNQSFQTKADIQGLSFNSKQSVNVKKVQIASCFKMTKDGVIAPISFYVPRKRTDFFQDDLYSPVLDTATTSLDIDISKDDDKSKIKIDLSYVSLKPEDMELLSNAPEEEKTEYQKRRNSQIKLLEQEKLKEQPKSTEQAFDQFSRMVADAPTANRWDAVNIGTEVAEDEWSD